MSDTTIQELTENNNHKAEFADKFKELTKEYGIDQYVFVLQDDKELLTLCEPNDIITTTRMLKIAHQNFYTRVLMEIGEGQ